MSPDINVLSVLGNVCILKKTSKYKCKKKTIVCLILKIININLIKVYLKLK